MENKTDSNKCDVITQYKIVAVKWLDAALYSGWHSETPKDLQITITVGMIVFESESALSLAMSINDYKFGDVLVIPSECIIEIFVMNDFEFSDGYYYAELCK